MKTPAHIALAVILISSPAIHAQITPLSPGKTAVLDKPIKQVAQAKDLESLIEHIKKMETIKVGMTREQLEKHFSCRTGIISAPYSEPAQEKYRYNGCHYIWVDVIFAKEGQNPPHKHDKILKISKPYLLSKNMQ